MKNKRSLLSLVSASLFILLFGGCAKPTDPNPSTTTPTVLTTTPVSQGSNVFTVGGNVTDNGGDNVTGRGICYSTLRNPDITGNKIISGSGNGTFTSSLTGLQPNTTYYIRAYATNSIGTAYGNEVSVQTQTTQGPVDPEKLLFIGGYNGLYCFDAQNGNLKWQRALGGKVFSTPCYSNGMVYVGCNDSKLYALDTAGVVKWSVGTGTEPVYFSSPVVYNNTVIICSNNKILAYNAATGILKWQFTPPFNYSVVGSLTLANSIIYANYSGLTGFNPETGALLWNKYTQNENLKPKVFNTKAYGIFDYDLRILDAGSGNILMTKYIGVGSGYAINLAYGNIYVYTGDGLRAYDTLTGNLKWSVPPRSWVDVSAFSGGSSPVIQDSIVHLINNGHVELYNAITGVLITSYGSNIAHGDITIVNGNIYYGNRDQFTTGIGNVFSARVWKATSTVTMVMQNWKSTVKGDFSSTPCIVTASGKMYRAGDAQ